MKKIIMLIFILSLSCDKTTTTASVDAGVCPTCVCPKVSPACTTQNIENCVEQCFSKNKCFFSFSPKSCFKKCSDICLNKFGCKWAN